MITHQLNTEVSHDGSIVLPKRLRRLADKKVKVIVIEESSTDSKYSIAQARGCLAGSGYTLDKYLADKQAEKVLER